MMHVGGMGSYRTRKIVVRLLEERGENMDMEDDCKVDDDVAGFLLLASMLSSSPIVAMTSSRSCLRWERNFMPTEGVMVEMLEILST